VCHRPSSQPSADAWSHSAQHSGCCRTVVRRACCQLFFRDGGSASPCLLSARPLRCRVRTAPQRRWARERPATRNARLNKRISAAAPFGSGAADRHGRDGRDEWRGPRAATGATEGAARVKRWCRHRRGRRGTSRVDRCRAFPRGRRPVERHGRRRAHAAHPELDDAARRRSRRVPGARRRLPSSTSPCATCSSGLCGGCC
jgi:hypothetical protein